MSKSLTLKKAKTAPVVATKEVTKKVLTATKAKPVAKAEKKPAAPRYEVGGNVQFTGYSEAVEGGLFTEGQVLTIVEVVPADAESAAMLSCIAADSYADYQLDPESVEGEQVSLDEVIAIKSKSNAVAKIVKEEATPFKNIGEMEEILKGGTPLEVAVTLFEDTNRTDFYLGGVLSKIYGEALYKEAGFTGDNGWSEYLLQTFGFKERKASYLMQIYQIFSQIDGLDVAKLSSIGWSKASKIANYVTAQNVDELLTLADESSILDLDVTLKEDFTTDGANAQGKSATRNSGKVKRITFGPYRLFEDTAEGTAMVITEAKKQFGADYDDHQVFERIVQEWAADHLGEDKQAKVSKAVSAKSKELAKAGLTKE